MILLVAIQLHPPRNVPGVLADIDSNSDAFQTMMRGVWLVDTQEGPEWWTEVLRARLTNSDTLLVIQVQDNYDGWLTDDAWDWLTAATETGSFEADNPEMMG